MLLREKIFFFHCWWQHKDVRSITYSQRRREEFMEEEETTSKAYLGVPKDLLLTHDFYEK